MKKFLFMPFFLVLTIALLPSTVLAGSDTGSSETALISAASNSDTSDSQAMYRLYNPNSGEHFFTANISEKDHLDKIGWNYEGIAWYAPKTSSIPVYRLYNKNDGEHHYTTNKSERDSLVKQGWKNEGTGWYSDPEKAVPLYRVYNKNAFSNNHHYTKAASERDHLISLGWRNEGIGWYGIKVSDIKPVVVKTFGGHTYAVFNGNYTPVEAEALSNQMGGYVVSVNSKDENDFLVSLFEQGGMDGYYIGATDRNEEGHWEWMNGDPWEYENWYPGGFMKDKEPNNGQGRGDENYCKAYKDRDWMWVDVFGDYDNESTKGGFVCEWNSTKEKNSINYESKYKIFKSDSWADAETYCKSVGGHLATITSKEEDEYVFNLCRESEAKGNAYFGLLRSDNGQWYWENGESFQYSNWHKGEPNNQDGTERYGMYYAFKYTDGSWNDGTGKDGYYICEWDL